MPKKKAKEKPVITISLVDQVNLRNGNKIPLS